MCVIDNKPRKSLSEGQKESLRALSQQVMRLLDLRKKNDVLEQANKEITRLNDELSHFAYRLTHDLKTPIRGINALAEFIKEDFEESSNGKAMELIDLISSKTIYMESMIEQLLLYTKVTNVDLNFEKFNLKSTLADILKNCDLENKVRLNFSELNQEITHSKISFVQIFQNLLTNSNKFCDENQCEVEVNFTKTDEVLKFVYMDNGPGIPQSYRDKIFLMFETLENANYQNTGIGLATVKSIVSRLGGDISLTDRPDGERGVCFIFTIKRSAYLKNIEVD